MSENERKSLTCVPGNGHPDPTVTWYIGNTVKATGREYSFEPSNSLHGHQIYCVADNIPSNGIYDAVSRKHTLFVTGKFTDLNFSKIFRIRDKIPRKLNSYKLL